MALVLVLAMALPAAATEGSTTLTFDYTPEPLYTLTFPASQQFDLSDDSFQSIGMVNLTSSSLTTGQALQVVCSITPFTGENKEEYEAFLRYYFTVNGSETISGGAGSSADLGPLTLLFNQFDENGSLKNVATDPNAGEWADLQVGGLMVMTLLKDCNAPAGQYTSTITYTSSVVTQ